MKTEDKMHERLNYLLAALESELKELQLRTKETLYTVSLDSQWVAHAGEFIKRFIEDFYIKLCAARALSASLPAATG